MKIYFASGNLNKQKEVASIFEGALPHVQILGVHDLDQAVQDRFSPQEKGKTFLENAQIKALEFSKILPGEYVLAEDSGLVIPSLNGAPGIFSSRYGKDDSDRIQRLLKEMQNLSGAERKAYFFASVCFLDRQANPIFFQGKSWGEIALQPKGEYGFGYDPVFYLPQIKKSFAQLTLNEKQKYSHRKKAFQKLTRLLKSID